MKWYVPSVTLLPSWHASFGSASAYHAGRIEVSRSKEFIAGSR